MIQGNPYEFAIIIKKIEEWNIDNTFCNGILLFCIDGYIYPSKICTSTLKSEIGPLTKKLKNIPVNNHLFNMKKDLAFFHIYKMIFPEDYMLSNDYQFDITPLSFADENCFIFAVSNSTHVRLLGAELKYIKEKSQHDLENLHIKEAFISTEKLTAIANCLELG